MKKIHTLLVGINNYAPASKVGALEGCANDVRAFEKHLNTNYSNRLGKQKVLLNSDATRQNIIKHFQSETLADAKAGDTALFYFSGHGAREASHSDLHKYYPEGKNETLVCYDSRLEGHWDLADKELGVLVADIAEKGVEVIVILDCCHSGSGSRGINESKLGKARQWDDSLNIRPVKEYLNGRFKTAAEIVRNSNHITLAACAKDEKAFELKNKRGLFSFQLLKVLEAAKRSSLSYLDLFEESRLAMRRITKKQNPQFDTSGFFNGNRYFLQSEGEKDLKEFKLYFEDNYWRVNAGVLQHLPTSKEKRSSFQLMNFGSENPAFVKTQKVLLKESIVDASSLDLDQKKTYSVGLISLPLSPVLVKLEGRHSEIVERIFEMKSTYNSVYFDLTQKEIETEFSLKIIDSTSFQITDNQTNAILRIVEGTNLIEIFKDIFEHLDKISIWEKYRNLDNDNSAFDRNKVDFILTELDPNLEIENKNFEEEVVLNLLEYNEGFKKNIRFEVRNNNLQKIHAVLLMLTDDFSIIPVFNDAIPAKKTIIAWDKDEYNAPLFFELEKKENPKVFQFKLLVSSEKLPDYLLQSKGFELGETASFWTNKSMHESILANLKGGLGGSYRKKSKQTLNNDWYAKNKKVEIRREEAYVGESEISIADDFIKIMPHSEFRGSLALAEVQTGTRSLDDMSFLAEFATKSGFELLPFGRNTKSISKINSLEINEIENEESLKDNPLILEINQHLEENESLLPITFDGEFIMPFGDLEQTEEGKTIVKIHHIPKQSVTKRSVVKALKLVFLKLAFKKETAQLRWVEYGNGEAVRCTEGLATKVEEAENILLLIHGIIGDTQGQANFAESLFADKENKEELSKEKPFDLILTFDYENLNTKIETTAANLKTALEEAGISTKNNKKIMILAHSMGGLVARYFIEVLNGKKIVERLIMAGTPNGGSAIAKLPNHRDKALTFLGFILNFVSVIPFAGKLVKVLNGSQKVTVTLEQMDWEDDSKFLKNLSKSEDPHVAYDIFAGNMEKYMAQNPDTKRLKNRLIKAGGKLFYKKQINDLAVSQASIFAISNKREPSPNKHKVVCHHLNYFEEGGIEEVI